MNKILFIFAICLTFACGGSKAAIQQTNTIDTQEQSQKSQVKSDTVKIKIPIEEKAPDGIIEQIVPETNNESHDKKESETHVKLDDTGSNVSGQEKPETNDNAEVILEAFDHSTWNDLLSKYVSSDGKVNYKGFKQNRKVFKTYLTSLSENMPEENWSKENTLAYWINVYNAFTVKLIIDNYPLQSIKDIKDPWDLRFFKLGTKWYTLNDVEHRILRKMGDPRIHFGINCASFSCPKLLNKAFTAQNVNKELDNLSISFINDSQRNIITTNKIQLSKIFSWFGKDFKTEGSLIDFLNKYSKIKINSNAKKTFVKYDWTLNE